MLEWCQHCDKSVSLFTSTFQLLVAAFSPFFRTLLYFCHPRLPHYFKIQCLSKNTKSIFESKSGPIKFTSKGGPNFTDIKSRIFGQKWQFRTVCCLCKVMVLWGNLYHKKSEAGYWKFHETEINFSPFLFDFRVGHEKLKFHYNISNDRKKYGKTSKLSFEAKISVWQLHVKEF